MIEKKEYLEINQEILGGLKTSIERGGTLKEAMMSFYRAGYDKLEIEKAAKAYVEIGAQQMPEVPEQKNKKGIVPKEEVKKIDTPKPNEEKQTIPEQEKKEIKPSGKPIEGSKIKKAQVVQKVSKYGDAKPPAGKIITFILITTLILLLGVLVAVVLFKEELVVFFNNLFG